MGVPELLFPLTGEQQAVARRVQEMGAGRLLTEAEAAGPERLRRAIRAALADDRCGAPRRPCAGTFSPAAGPGRRGLHRADWKKSIGLSPYVCVFAGTNPRSRHLPVGERTFLLPCRNASGGSASRRPARIASHASRASRWRGCGSGAAPASATGSGLRLISKERQPEEESSDSTQKRGIQGRNRGRR